MGRSMRCPVSKSIPKGLGVFGQQGSDILRVYSNVLKPDSQTLLNRYVSGPMAQAMLEWTCRIG